MKKETKKMIVTVDRWPLDDFYEPLDHFCEMMRAASKEAGSSLAGADYHEHAINDDGLFNVAVVALPNGGIIRVHSHMIIGNVTPEQFAELKKIAVNCCGANAVKEVEVEKADLEKKNYAIFDYYDDDDNDWNIAIETSDFCGCLQVTEEQAAAYILKWDQDRDHEVKLKRFDFHVDDFLDVRAY